MLAGRLRHRIEVQVAVPVQDASGDEVVDWAAATVLGTVWGAIEPIRGREATYAGDQILAEMDTRITVRWSPLAAQITAGHRLVHQGTPFNVVSVAHVKLAQREVEILCRSGINDG
jgi:SPP1 family predicted phage head-tail adaptor